MGASIRPVGGRVPTRPRSADRDARDATVREQGRKALPVIALQDERITLDLATAAER